VNMFVVAVILLSTIDYNARKQKDTLIRYLLDELDKLEQGHADALCPGLDDDGNAIIKTAALDNSLEIPQTAMPVFCDLNAISDQLNIMNLEIEGRFNPNNWQPCGEPQLGWSNGLDYRGATPQGSSFQNISPTNRDERHDFQVRSTSYPNFTLPELPEPSLAPNSSSSVLCSGDVQLEASYHQYLPNAFQPTFNHLAGSAVNIRNPPMPPTSPAPSPQPRGSYISDSRTQATSASISLHSTKSKIRSKVSPPDVFVPCLPSLMANKDAWKVVVSHWQDGIPEHSVLPLCKWDPSWKKPMLYKHREIIALEFLIRCVHTTKANSHSLNLCQTQRRRNLISHSLP
jgi:hypothetical protein